MLIPSYCNEQDTIAILHAQNRGNYQQARQIIDSAKVDHHQEPKLCLWGRILDWYIDHIY